MDSPGRNPGVFFCVVLCRFFVGLLVGVVLYLREVIHMMAHTAIVVRSIRRRMGWTRKDMARIIGTTAAHLGRVDRAQEKLDKDVAARLCAATGAKFDQIW